MIGRLGKRAPRRDHRTLKLSRYVTAALPPAPAAVDWTEKMTFPAGQMLNDQLGDCTCAALGHLIQAWTANTGSQVTVPDSAILKAYEQACGYDPNDPGTDQGGIEIDVLNYFRTTGVGGYKADAFVALQPENEEHIKISVDLFGGVYIGLELPKTIDQQDDWFVDITAGAAALPGSLGGHAVVVEAYDADWLTIVTWGQKKRMSWDFWRAYTSESYAVLSKLWTRRAGVSPVGFDYATLLADLKAVIG